MFLCELSVGLERVQCHFLLHPGIQVKNRPDLAAAVLLAVELVPVSVCL